MPHGWDKTDIMMSRQAFILANTSPKPCLNITHIKLYQTEEVHDLWQKTEAELNATNLPPPFWAFAWAGGEGLAQYVLEHPETVKNKTVLDFASGSGLVAIAAKMAGAKTVLANDIDPFAVEAIALNAKLNSVTLNITNKNIVGSTGIWDIILAGDIFYEKPMTEKLMKWLKTLTHRGINVLAGDPGRAYVPHNEVTEKACYQLTASKAIEDTEYKTIKIYEIKS